MFGRETVTVPWLSLLFCAGLTLEAAMLDLPQERLPLHIMRVTASLEFGDEFMLRQWRAQGGAG